MFTVVEVNILAKFLDRVQVQGIAENREFMSVMQAVERESNAAHDALLQEQIKQEQLKQAQQSVEPTKPEAESVAPEAAPAVVEAPNHVHPQ